MKKSYCLTIFLVLLSFFAEGRAQTSVVAHVDMPFEVKSSIIREYTYPTTISYLESIENGYFVYADSTLSATYIPLNPKYSVNDFVINYDTVWFCGKTSGDVGFVGFLDINDFFFGSNNYYIISNYLPTANSSINDLTKLVSYIDNSNIRHIVAIGTTELGQYCVVNMTHRTTPTWHYETGEVPAASPETMVAIQITDDNVFTGGMYLLDTTNPGLALRAYDRDSVFTKHNNIYNYANEIVDVAAQYSFCLDQVALLKMSCSEIGVAAFYKSHQNGAITTMPEGTYIGRYVLGTPKTIFTHLHSILAPHTYDTGGWKLHNFSKLYLPDCTFNLLQEYELSFAGDLQSVVYELSTNIVDNVVPFSYVTTADYVFQSIDGYHSTPNYLINGYSAGLPSFLVYNMGVQGNNNCLSIKDLNPDPIDMTCITHYAPFSMNEGKISFIVLVSSNQTENILIDCSAKSGR